MKHDELGEETYPSLTITKDEVNDVVAVVHDNGTLLTYELPFWDYRYPDWQMQNLLSYFNQHGKERISRKNHMKVIYQLRAQCNECNLDKMILFYRVPNARPYQMYKGHEQEIKERWPLSEKQGGHNCNHKINFTRTTITDYRWDEKEGKAVKVEV